METYFYVCPVCGFVYQIPSYWANHSPDASTEFEHLDLRTKDLCPEKVLVLLEENKK